MNDAPLTPGTYVREIVEPADEHNAHRWTPPRRGKVLDVTSDDALVEWDTTPDAEHPLLRAVVGMHAERVPLAAIAREVIHVLDQGMTLCRTVHGFPRDWPPGHVWVRVEVAEHASCEACTTRLASLRERLPEEEVRRRLREIAHEEVAKLPPAQRLFAPVDASHEQVITSALLSIRGAHAVLAIWQRGGLAGELTLSSVRDAELIARKLGLRDTSEPTAPDVYACTACGRETPHVHEHDTAHGIAETHMAGSERFRCTDCGKTTHAHEPGAERMRFVYDKPGRQS